MFMCFIPSTGRNIYLHASVYIHMTIHTFNFLDVYMYLYMYISCMFCAYMYMYVYMYMYMCVCVCACGCMSVCAFINVSLCVRMIV